MSKESEFNNLLYIVRSHYTNGIHTYGQCVNKCGKSARGGGTCAFCAEKQIAELIDNEYIANKIHNFIQYQAEAIASALDIIELADD